MFKKGDKVKLTCRRMGDDINNPIWGGKHGKVIGEIMKIHKGVFDFNIFVEWRIGYINIYRENHLEKLLTNPNSEVVLCSLQEQ